MDVNKQQKIRWFLYRNLAPPLTQLVEGTLKFSTANVYENYFNNPEILSIPEFISMSEAIHKIGYGPNNRNAEDIAPYLQEWKDASILNLLDEDGMIIIGKYLIYLDFENKIVAVTDEHSLKETILSKNFDDPRIHIFSFEDDVLELLDSDPDFIEQKSADNKENYRVMSCPGSFPPGTPVNIVPNASGTNCSDKKCDYTRPHYQEGDFQYRVIATHVYQPAGIYFRLKSELVNQRRPIGGSWTSQRDDSMRITFWGNMTPKNRSTIQLSDCNDICQGCWPPPADRDKIQKIHHEAARSLTQYILYGIYEFNLGGNHASSGYSDYFELYRIKSN